MSWKDLMSNFVEFETKKEEMPVSKAVSLPPSSSVSDVELSGKRGATPMATVTTVASVDTKPFESKLWGKLTTDPIYSKFHDAMESMREVLNDEGQIVKAALKILERQGVGYGQVVAAVGGLSGSLDAESSHFSDLLASQRTSEVQSREKKIQDLSTQIQGLKDQQSTLASEVLEQKNKLNAVEAGFNAAKSKIQEEIGDISRKLNLYGPATNQTAGGK